MATKVVKAKKERKIRYEDAPLVKRFISYLIDWYVGALCTAIPIAIISQKLTNTMLNQNIVEFKQPYGIIAGILAVLFAIFYFVLIMPQRKKQKQQKAMIDAAVVGDDIVSIGGISGRICSIKDDYVTIESGADKTKIKLAKWAIRDVEKKITD